MSPNVTPTHSRKFQILLYEKKFILLKSNVTNNINKFPLIQI